jgi:hypothetical protein
MVRGVSSASAPRLEDVLLDVCRKGGGGRRGPQMIAPAARPVSAALDNKCA